MATRELIKSIFFDEIINEAKLGEVRVKIDNEENIFNVGFNTCIEGVLESGNFGDSKPILMVNNKEQLTILLEQYFNECDKHENKFSNCKLEEKIKIFLTLIWSNATYEDFANPTLFIKRRIEFYQNKLFDFESKEYSDQIELLDNSKIIIHNNLQDINEETPYLFKISFQNEDESFDLPSISYGISNDECYIYNIQNSKESESLISLSIFLDILNKYGIEKVKVVSLLPVRYNSKEQAFTKKYEYELKNKELSDKELKKLLLEYKKENLKNQKISSEIMIENFRNLEQQFNNCIITAYPMEFDEYLHMNVRQFTKTNNDFLNEIMSLKKFDISK